VQACMDEVSWGEGERKVVGRKQCVVTGSSWYIFEVGRKDSAVQP
jgi:hypothetical protein